MHTIIRVHPNTSGINAVNTPLDPFSPPFIIDFSGVTSIDSTGLNIFLIRLLKALRTKQDTKYTLIQPNCTRTAKFLRLSNFEYCLRKHIYPSADVVPYPLFPEEFGAEVNFNPNTPTKTIIGCNSKYSYPIYLAMFEKSKNKRETVAAIEDYIESTLNSHSVKINILLFRQMLKEIFKNSADHTNSNAGFGIDLIENSQNNVFYISFSYCDLGIGIYEKVKENIKNSNDWAPRDKLAVAKTYHKALKHGFSTKIGNGINFGMGLSIILEASKSLNANIYTFDGRSMCALSRMSEDMTSKEIRDNIYNLGKNQSFFIFGEVTENE